MAGPVNTIAFGVQDAFAVRAIVRIGPNQRVSASTGLLGTVLDVLTFPGAPLTPTVTGQWLVPNQRCLIGGVATISVSAVGVGLSPVPAPTGPLLVVQPDPRVRAG